jgi:hypothetical protein
MNSGRDSLTLKQKARGDAAGFESHRVSISIAASDARRPA